MDTYGSWFTAIFRCVKENDCKTRKPQSEKVVSEFNRESVSSSTGLVNVFGRTEKGKCQGLLGKRYQTP